MTEQTLHFLKKPDYQRIAKDKVVRLKYLVSDADSKETIEYRDDLYYLHGGYGGALPKVEEALQGEEVGAKVEVALPAEEAYGPFDPALRITDHADNFPPEAREPGTRLEAQSADGRVIEFVVVQVDGDMVTVDANHPLAGRNLQFLVEVLEIRPAEPAELTAGYAFAPGALAETPTEGRPN